ncbi:TolC family protein [Caulobacter segnis]|uniref:TolC family protein n=1 Tax=Caulobacter segnis TaxID=88688 RepID=UPI001CBFCAE7|nr:TolC family protein [Caulobacter segnis]UAL10083.1 TolC family protein [Caulobacter segnis]
MRIAITLAATLLAGAAHAAPLTYAQALDTAAANAPSLRAAALQVEAAKASAKAAGALPDPKLALGLDNFPVSGPPAGRFGADEMTMGRVGFSQDVPSAAKRQARIGRAEADIVTAGAEGAVEARQVRVATALAWIQLLYAQRKVAALDGVVAQLAPLWSAAPSGVASGRSRPAQALEAAQMRAALEDRRSEAVSELGRARAMLVRWTGDADPQAVGEAPDLDLAPANLRAAIDRNPVVLAKDAAARQAQADVALAKADKRPDWSWEVAYQRRDPMFGDMVSAGVSVSLPLWGKSRQDPMIAARAASAGRADAQREDARRALAAQLEADLADHVMHHDQWLRARDTLLPLAKQRAQLETAAYGAGTAGLPDVLTAFSGLADAQLTTLDREAAVAVDAARLTLTYGNDQ